MSVDALIISHIKPRTNRTGLLLCGNTMFFDIVILYMRQMIYEYGMTYYLHPNKEGGINAK